MNIWQWSIISLMIGGVLLVFTHDSDLAMKVSGILVVGGFLVYSVRRRHVTYRNDQ